MGPVPPGHDILCVFVPRVLFDGRVAHGFEGSLFTVQVINDELPEGLSATTGIVVGPLGLVVNEVA